MLAGGRIVKGHKVGLTSAAMQKQLGVDQPDFGHLLDDFFFLEHMPIPMDRWPVSYTHLDVYKRQP